MSRIDDYLATGEHLLVATRAHAAALGRPLALAGATAALGVLAALSIDRAPVASAVTGALTLAASLFLLTRIRRWHASTLAVTDGKLLLLSGTAGAPGRAIAFGSVDDVAVHQTRAGQLFGYGTVEVIRGDRRNRLRYVPRPHVVTTLLRAHR